MSATYDVTSATCVVTKAKCDGQRGQEGDQADAQEVSRRSGPAKC